MLIHNNAAHRKEEWGRPAGGRVGRQRRQLSQHKALAASVPGEEAWGHATLEA